MAISGGDGSIILTTKVDTKGLDKGLRSMKNMVGFVGKVFAVIGVGAATATAAITKMAVSAYADYEQLVGGVETLFGKSANKVMEYANQAFMTAGVSANEYMQQVTSFAASLVRSTAGDTEKAADIANMALMDISDNVNKMGSSMESVTWAYQGFAKQQYVLLDNLKLGYGGTKTEMERLLRDAEAITGVKYDISNLADVYNAIHVMQQELGITGTTMKEAETTITGSLSMVKASWQNLLIAMSGGGDLDRAINNFVYALSKFTDNIVPIIERTLIGLGQAIQRTLPQLVQTVVSALIQAIPAIVAAVYNMIIGLFKGVVAGINALFTGKKVQIAKPVVSGVSGGGGYAPSGGSGGNGGGGGSGGSGNGKKKGKSPEEQQVEAEEKAIQDKIKALQKENKQIRKNDKANQQANKKQLASFDDINTLSETRVSEADAAIDANNEQIDQLQEQLELLREKKQAIQDANSAAGTGSSGVGGGADFGGVDFGGVGGGGLLGAMGDMEQEIDAQLQAIMAIAGTALVAIGLLLLFSGNVAWGLGFIITGAITFAVAAVNSEKYDVATEIIGVLTTIMGIAGGALLALGIILLWLGGVVGKGFAIGMIIAGAALIVSAVATQVAFSPDDIKGWLSKILGIAAGALLALGIILCMVGSVPIGVGMIIAGSVALVSAVALNFDEVTNKIEGWVAVIMGIAGGALLVLGIVLCVTGAGIALGVALIVAGAIALVTPIALNWEYITEKVKQFIQDNSGLIMGISLALLVLGIILCCVGVINPLSIGLIAAGAVGLATEIALNWDYISTSITNFIKDNSGLIVGVSLALLVLGIILLFTGVGIPLAVGLIVAGGGALAAEAAVNWNFIVEKVKDVWESVKQFWNENIAPVFTAEWWKNLGKTVMNGFIGGFEAGINGIISMFENMINWIVDGINKISFDVPDWVPEIGGTKFGFNLSRVSLGRVSIPRLAQGTVIPPNREFMAILGDQKKGVNIEAPLQTIVDAFNIALANNDNAKSGNTEVVLEIDGREFGRAVVEQGNRENRRIGTRLVIA